MAKDWWAMSTNFCFQFIWLLFEIIDQSITSTKTKCIKLNTKTQIFLMTLDFCIHFESKNFFFSFGFLVAPVKVYKKVVKISFRRQKIFWVLVFSFMYLVLVDAMDKLHVLLWISQTENKNKKFKCSRTLEGDGIKSRLPFKIFPTLPLKFSVPPTYLFMSK